MKLLAAVYSPNGLARGGRYCTVAPMQKLVLLAAILGSVACSKADQSPSNAPNEPVATTAPAVPTSVPTATAPVPAAPAPAVVQGPTAAATDPANLPPAGTAPTPVVVDKELDPIWNASIRTIKGQPTTLAPYKGKALLLVNVASQCGLTPQFAALEALQKKYASRGFTVVGFPSNDFGNQEPGTNEEIATFCSTTYGITFPIMEKIHVNGDERHAIFKALTPIADIKGRGGDLKWNFEKWVVSADAKRVTRFRPMTTPDDPIVIAAVEAALPR
jgi:glutathione peroxidase